MTRDIGNIDSVTRSIEFFPSIYKETSIDPSSSLGSEGGVIPALFKSHFYHVCMYRMLKSGRTDIYKVSITRIPSLQRRLHIQIRPLVVALRSVIFHPSCEAPTKIRVAPRRSRPSLRERALQFVSLGLVLPSFLPARSPLVGGEGRAVAVGTSLALLEPYGVHRVRGRREGVRVGMLAVGRAGEGGRARSVRVTALPAARRSSIERSKPELAEDRLIGRLLGRCGRVHFLPRPNHVLPPEGIAGADLLYRAREYQCSESETNQTIVALFDRDKKKEHFEKAYLLLPPSFHSSPFSFSADCFLLLPLPSRLSLDLENGSNDFFSPMLGRVRVGGGQPSW